MKKRIQQQGSAHVWATIAFSALMVVGTVLVIAIVTNTGVRMRAINSDKGQAFEFDGDPPQPSPPSRVVPASVEVEPDGDGN